MFHTFRLQKIMLQGLLRGEKQNPFSETRTYLRVLPDDLDLNMHMNNGRYLKAMDLGRWDYMSRTGLLSCCFRERWRIVAGAIDISYLRSLGPFQSYTLVTKLESWDQKWWIMQQRFLVGEKIHAIARVRKLFIDREGKQVPTARVFQAFGMEPLDPPRISPATEAWLVSLKKWREKTPSDDEA